MTFIKEQVKKNQSLRKANKDMVAQILKEKESQKIVEAIRLLKARGA